MTITIIIMENLQLLLYISDGLSVDWLSNKLYISGNDRLGVVDLSNGYHKELNSTTSAYYYWREHCCGSHQQVQYDVYNNGILYCRSDATLDSCLT